MGQKTGISWCDDTINPTSGCDGCELWKECQELRGWKESAMRLLSEWDKIWETLGRPGQLGSGKAEEALKTVEAMIAEVAELSHSAELQQKASQRAITRWQTDHPDRAGVWPDKSELDYWLMEQWDATRAERDELAMQLREQIAAKDEQIARLLEPVQVFVTVNNGMSEDEAAVIIEKATKVPNGREIIVGALSPPKQPPSYADLSDQELDDAIQKATEK